MQNTVSISNWTDQDHKVLYESLKGEVDRTPVRITINRSLLERYDKLHPRMANNRRKGKTLSDAINIGLLIYMKLYEDE